LGLKAEDMAVSTLELEEYQIISSTTESVEVFVPSKETDALYAKVQHDMKMMDDLEWDMYKKAYTFLKREIIDTDLDLVLNAPPDVLYARIIDERGRDFEQQEFFENNPDYLPRLATAVSVWGWMKEEAGEKPIVLIDSASNNFVSNAKDKEKVLKQIENEIVDFLSKNSHGKDGCQFIVPDFLKVK
jgi:deoxyadenosine/deoxycytidine kinase